MKSITIELPDEVYEVLQEMSERHDTPLEVLALDWFNKYRSKPKQISEQERRAAMEQLLKYAGIHKGGYPDGSENEKIDADLAREYENNHEADR